MSNIHIHTHTYTKDPIFFRDQQRVSEKPLCGHPLLFLVLPFPDLHFILLNLHLLRLVYLLPPRLLFLLHFPLLPLLRPLLHLLP